VHESKRKVKVEEDMKFSGQVLQRPGIVKNEGLREREDL
jgi:hypothetical protein